MGFERKLFQKILAAVPGTRRYEKKQVVNELYTQHHLEEFEKSGQEIEKMFLPLKERHDSILTANKKEIFSQVAQLDGKGIHKLDLRQCLPEFGRFWEEEVLKSKDQGRHLTGCGAVWFAQQTDTYPHDVYNYEDGVVRWLPGAQGLEKALWGAGQ